MSKKINYIGKKYGRLTVIRQDALRSEYYWCKCECGNEKYYRIANLRSGRSGSCGCIKKGRIKKHNDIDSLLLEFKETIKNLGYIPTSREYRDKLRILNPSMDSLRNNNLSYPAALRAVGYPSYGVGARIVEKYRICKNKNCYNAFYPMEKIGVIDRCYACLGLEEPETVFTQPVKKDKPVSREEIANKIVQFVYDNPTNVTAANFTRCHSRKMMAALRKEFSTWKNALNQVIDYELLIISNMKKCAKSNHFSHKEYIKRRYFPSWTFVKNGYNIDHLLKESGLVTQEISNVKQAFFQLPCNIGDKHYSLEMINDFISRFNYKEIISITPHEIKKNDDLSIRSVDYIFIYRC